MVTYIPATGFADCKVTISDHATPASATYAWGLRGVESKGKEPLKPMMSNFYPGGATILIKGYIHGKRMRFAKIVIDNNTDWQSLLKALSYWEKNESLLYLSLKNEWNSNLALWGSYANPTTLGQWTGRVENFEFTPYPNTVEVTIDFVYATS